MQELPAGSSERPPVPDDAIVVADLMAACVQADAGAEGTGVEHVLDDWHEVDLQEEAVLVLAPDGTAAGYVDVANRAFVSLSVYGYVHPDYRGRGIGSCLVGWGERWIEERIRLAPQGARVVVKHYVISTNSGARRLLDNNAYEAVRGTYVMEIDLEEEPPEPVWPEGLAVRTFVPGRSERAIFEAVEDAFRDVWGRPGCTFERFVGMTENENFDPSLWFLVMDGGGNSRDATEDGLRRLPEGVAPRRGSHVEGIPSVPPLFWAVGAVIRRVLRVLRAVGAPGNMKSGVWITFRLERFCRGERGVFVWGCVPCGAARGVLPWGLRLKVLRGRPGIDRLLRHLRRGAAAYGVLLISLLLTALAWYYVRDTVEEQNGVRFDETVRATQAAVERRTDDYLDAMFGARGLILASESVDPPEWKEYVKGVEPETRLGGLQALAFAERVEPSEREDFARRMKRDGLPGLQPDLDPGGEREVYFPISLTAPADEANREMFGRDEYPYSVYRTAMEQARDTGSPRATESTYVLTENPEGADVDLAQLQGFVVYLPVYEAGEPVETVAERRRALRGFIVGAFRRDGLLEALVGGSFDLAIDFEVYDGPDVESSELLYDADGIKRADSEGYDQLFSRERQIEVAGREWSLYFATLPRFERDAQSNLPLLVLVAGLGVSLLLFSIFWMLVRSRLRAERASEDLEDVNRELEGTNRELEAFSYSVSHDLRAPLRTIDGFSQILTEDYGEKLDEEGLDYLTRVRSASRHMAALIDDLLDLSRVGRRPLTRESVDLSALASGIAEDLRGTNPGRDVDFVIDSGVRARGDVGLLKVALENLLGNAWKFTAREPRATIRFGASGGAFLVSDDGAGFEDSYKDKLFGAFQRLHGPEEFEGTGIGLATVARIVHRHGGEVWAEGAVGEGATFFFTLGGKDRPSEEAAVRKRETA